MRIICKIMTIFALFGCLNASNIKPIISVDIEPIAYLLKQIAKDDVIINVIINEHANEHHLVIKPDIMNNLEHSQIYFTLGLEFEEELIKQLRSNYPNLEFINLTSGIKKLKLGDDLDPHVWMDPILMKQMAKKIATVLEGKYPKHKEEFAKNLKILDKKLSALNIQLAQILSPIKGKAFVSFHPSWGYFAKRYDLEQIAIEKHGKEPRLSDLLKLADFIKNEGIKTVFIQDGFDTRMLDTLKQECNIRVEKLQPLGFDYEANMLQCARKIANSYK